VAARCAAFGSDFIGRSPGNFREFGEKIFSGPLKLNSREFNGEILAGSGANFGVAK
jgi:hypothetical protein